VNTESAVPFAPERRTRPEATSVDELLQQVPARVVLDRLPAPVVGFGTDGATSYANPAFCAMLGYLDASTVLDRSVGTLLVGRECDSPKHSIAMLRSADGKIIDWIHSEGFPVHTLVSSPLLLRATDPLVMFSVNDVTELLWVDAPRNK
jgi:PAS domain-containing protein